MQFLIKFGSYADDLLIMDTSLNINVTWSNSFYVECVLMSILLIF